MANALTSTLALGATFSILTLNAGVLDITLGAGGGGGGVTSFNARTGAVVPLVGDYAASLVTNDSAVAGTSVAAALNTLNAPIDLTGSRVVAGPANSFLGSNGTTNQWLPVFTSPTNPGQNGFIPRALNGDFSYIGGASTGQMLNWNGSQWQPGVDFGALTPITTDGFAANASTGYIRLGLASGSGSGVASAASAGNIRGARGTLGFVMNVRNNADSADLTLLTTDTVSGPGVTLGSTSAGGFSPTLAAPSAGSIVLRVGSSATQTALTTTTVSTLQPTISFFTSVAAPIFQQQSDTTNGVTGKKLVINAQDCSGTTTTGGALDIRPGLGTTAGGLGRLVNGAASPSQRFGWNDTGIGLYTTAPVAQAARVGQLTDNSTGAATGAVADVGAVYSQAGLNNIHASILAKLNAIELAIHNIGLTA